METVLTRRRLLYAVASLTAAAALGATVPGAAQATMAGLQSPLPPSAPMSAGSYVPAPAAWFTLLRQFPGLDLADAVFEPARLTVARAAQLIKVNKEVNAALRYRDDTGKDRWEIGWRDGDCEDFAIRKLRELIVGFDFPRGALTLAACRLDRGRGHAVLLVHSDRGVYVMDNLTPRVLPWRRLPYGWVAREEPGAPFRLWRALA